MATIPWNGSAPARANRCARTQTGDWTARCVFAALAGAFVLLAWPLWQGQTYLHDDALAFHLPLRAHYAACLQRGAAFDWMPQLFCGWYATGEGQLGGYHPLHWLLYRCLPLQTAFSLEVAVNYPLCWVGLYLLLRRRGLSVAAAALGGGCFALGSFNLLHLAHVNGVAVVAHLPWLLLCADALSQTRGWGRVRLAAAIGLLTGSQCLLGYPQYLLFTLAAEVAWLAGAQLQRTSWVNWATWLAGKTAGLAVGAVQLWPTLETLAQSTRAGAGPEFALTGSLHPLNVLQLVAPYLTATRVWGENTHELGMYLGAGPLVLLLAGCALRRFVEHESNRLYWWGLALAGVAGLYALGGYGGVYPLQARLPVLGCLRFPCRAIVLLQFGLAIATAVAFDAWRRHSVQDDSSDSGHARRGLRTPLVWSVVAASVVVALAGEQLVAGTPVSAWPWLALGPGLFLVAAALYEGGLGRRTWAPAALAVFCVAELAAYGWSYSVWGRCGVVTPGQVPANFNSFSRALIDLPGTTPRTGNAAVLAGTFLADGYAGLEPRRSLELNTLAALQAAGVARVRRTPQSEQIVGLEPVDDQWLAVPHPVPSAHVVTDARCSDDPARDLQSIDLQTTALVAGPAPALHGEPGSVAVVQRESGYVRLAPTGGVPQLLVVSESFHPGWRAFVDGAEQEVLRVNGDFLGTVVSQRVQQVEFRFAPRSLAWARCVSACAAGWLLLGGLVGSVRPYLGRTQS